MLGKVRLVKYAGRRVISRSEASDLLQERILSGAPFLACRFGSSELNTVWRTLQKRITGNTYKYDEIISIICKQSGFFPDDLSYADAFTDCMIDSIRLADMVGIWAYPGEEYVLSRYAPDAQLTALANLEPWYLPENPWTKALAGKRVLVVHPFESTIQEQFAKRENLFPGTDILPEFELLTYKAVQTIAGNRDERFNTWFDALSFMEDQIRQFEFDIAIVGCGAYGLPLAASIKAMGRQAVHLGGATQLLFGIRGKRWDEMPEISKWYNDSWIRPLDQDHCTNYRTIEGGCYW